MLNFGIVEDDDFDEDVKNESFSMHLFQSW